MPLPHPLTFISSLFSSPTCGSTVPISPATTPLLLTLHCLFPSDLLPALDLLDRRLVTRFALQAPSLVAEANVSPKDLPSRPHETQKTSVYYVRSSQRPRSGSRHKIASTSYEVRLQAWNCSCPAFAFAAFEFENEGVRGVTERCDEDDSEGTRAEDRFGGLTLVGREVPVCKHLLACLLVNKVGGYEDFVEDRVVGREEMAGWAAGWGG